MKKIIIVLSLLLGLQTQSNAKWVIGSIDVSFGYGVTNNNGTTKNELCVPMPSICNITINHVWVDAIKVNKLAFDDVNNILVMTLEKDLLPQDEIENYLNKDLFSMEKEFLFNSDFKKFFNTSLNSIQVGTYKIEETEKEFKITFNNLK